MKHIFIILGVVLLSIGLGNCKKESDEPKVLGPYYLDTIKSYCYFQPGSWWVYKNNVTAELDTLKCVISHLDTITSKPGDLTGRIVTFEYMYNRWLSSLDNSTYELYTTSRNPDATNIDQNKNSLYFYRYSPKYDFGTIRPFSYPYKYGKPAIGTLGEVETIHDNYTVGSKAYKHVVVFYIFDDYTSRKANGGVGTSARYYWVKEVGIIKREVIHSNYSWELVDYFINE